ncbi:proteasome subunit alpha type protein (macronuclear) [Tetrahymena thermophila SB210]|uniref:Proteasome subunit alpha type protein n=1 Tax=Tetrahymena thermophila (strain SB210) TaxID=312017 RepID=Q23DV5_TETTS|nr:proteasome subunit alpha type protein [Tetrahymena thermophila SB210]EAR94553.2 proteasome subunit alpha type protein [Tetrahymena thermophila SB210]|eukprot:XP_001014581.2 proteasome subunit alpha type protein [Tetrahymena thermophila SB210]
MADSNYDRSVNTFSKLGQLLQVEYAMQAAKQGSTSTSIGIKVKGGVILAAERKFDSLQESRLMILNHNIKIQEIDTHICCVPAGIIPDARTLIDYARVESQNHRFTYNEPMSVRSLTQTVSDLALNFGEGDPSLKRKPMPRPFGVALLIAGVDETGPRLFKTDPSGSMMEYQATCIGCGQEGIQPTLVEKYDENMSIREAEVLALSCLKETMEQTASRDNLELAVIPIEGGQFIERTPDYIDEILQTLG